MMIPNADTEAKSDLSTREIRVAAGYSQAKASFEAGVSLNTWRAFELSELGVSEKNRRLCKVVRDKLEQLARAAA